MQLWSDWMKSEERVRFYMSTTFKIAGMSCGHCVMHVKKALAEVPGIESMEVAIGSATVNGTFDVEAVKKAIEEEAGYDVLEVK